MCSEPLAPNFVTLAACFFRMGAQSFGGLGAVLVLLKQTLVDRHHWLSESDIAEALTYAELLPGSTIVQVVVYLGWKLRGLSGSLIAVTAFLLPAFTLMLTLAVSYLALPQAGLISAFSTGLTASVVGLLIITIGVFGRKNIQGFGAWLIAFVALVSSVCFQINPALIVISAGVWGILSELKRKSS